MERHVDTAVYVTLSNGAEQLNWILIEMATMNMVCIDPWAAVYRKPPDFWIQLLQSSKNDKMFVPIADQTALPIHYVSSFKVFGSLHSFEKLLEFP